MVAARPLATLPRFMKRLLPFLAALFVLATAFAGCGGGGSSASSPLDEGLGFLPKDAPFAVAISTDTGSGQYQDANTVLKKFPFGEQAVASLRRRVEQSGLSYDKDVKPILGNPFVVGAPTPQSLQGGNSRNEYVAALKGKDSGKLEDLVKKGSKEVGDKNGFKLYESRGGTRLAFKDGVVVFAGSNKLLDDALAQRDRDDRLTEDVFNKGLDGLPSDAIVRIYGDAQRLIKASPNSAKALKVKWVAALRQFGATASVKQDAIDIDFNLHTDAGQLTDADLPLAPGNGAPQVVKQPGELSFGLRNPAQIEKFAEAAAQASNPSGFGQFQQGKAQIEKQLGIDFNKDVLDQLTGDVAANVTVAGNFGLRSQLKDAAAFRTTLKKVVPQLPKLAKSLGGQTIGIAKPRKGQDFYALAPPSGKTVVFGVVKDNLVVANDSTLAGRLATAPAEAVQGAEGSLVMSADARRLANAAIAKLGTSLGPSVALLGQRFTTPLGELTESVKSSTAGLSGKLSLGFH
jgi:hypothetical protein